MSGFFDDSHVTDIGLEGSLGPRVGFGEMIAQSFQQQFRVDSARALDNELRNRWLESLRMANISSGPATDPVGGTDAYRTFAQHVSGQPVEATGAAGWGLLGKQDPLDPIREMIIANDRIKELNNPNIKTFEQILEEVAQMQHEVEETTGSMYERSSAGGFVASLLGAIAGSFTTRDPLNIITAPIGAGRTITARIASEMAIAAGVVGYTELAEVAPARQIVGLPERDPLFNIAAATLGAGAIRGGIEGIGYGVGRLRGGRENIDFDARDAQLAQMFAANSDKPSARAGAMILDDAVFLERNNPFGEGPASQERFRAELQQIQRAMNGEPMTAIGRVMPPIPYEQLRKAGDFEFVREQAPELYAKMEAAQAKVATLSSPRLYHQGPSDLPGNVPTRSEGSFFGSDEFEEAFGAEFGSTRYTYRTPQKLLDKTLDVSQDNVEEVIRVFSKLWPDEERDSIAAALRNGDDKAWEDFYSEDWTLGTTIAKALEGTNYVGARYGSETFLTPSAIAELKFEKTGSALDPTERRAANAEYQAAYRAVEAEAARLRSQQLAVETAQRRESASIFLPTVEGRPFIGPMLQHDYIESLVERINKFNNTLDEQAVARFRRETLDEGENAVEVEVWERDGGIDIGLKDPVDPNFRFETDEGEMTVAAAMRDLQDDTDLDEAMRTCLL